MSTSSSAAEKSEPTKLDVDHKARSRNLAVEIGPSTVQFGLQLHGSTSPFAHQKLGGDPVFLTSSGRVEASVFSCLNLQRRLAFSYGVQQAKVAFSGVHSLQFVTHDSKPALLIALHHPPELYAAAPDDTRYLDRVADDSGFFGSQVSLLVTPTTAQMTSEWRLAITEMLGDKVLPGTNGDVPLRLATETPEEGHKALSGLLAAEAALPYRLRYILRALFDNQVLLPRETPPQLVSFLKREYQTNEASLMGRLTTLLHQRPGPLPPAVFKQRLQSLRCHEDFVASLWTADTALVHALVITPTRLVVEPPSREPCNPVLQRYRETHGDSNLDRFLRVQFLDEDLAPLDWDAVSPSVIGRIYRHLLGGIAIFGRHFKFLAVTAQQLWDREAWFYASQLDDSGFDKDGKEAKSVPTADSIRAECGDFSRIKCVSQYAARLGLCFTSLTAGGRPVVKMKQGSWAWLDDIPDPFGRLFTDGIGRISFSFAQEFADARRLKVVPSAFQIRFGGCSGVLATDPPHQSQWQQIGNKGRRPKFHLRPSMSKFLSEHSDLEVVRTSRFLAGHLNRQSITLLSSLGVRDRVFHHLQDQMLRHLHQMGTNRESATRMLLPLVSEHLGPFLLLRSWLGQFDLDEPFLEVMLGCIKAHWYRELRDRARIIVPRGASLMGVIDETGTLEYGEVFVQITSPTAGQLPALRTEVVVMRYPCLHPGNVLRLRAVDKPQLRHHVDVIVFPQKGQRPHPNEMAGGNLAGTQFFVSWEPELLPPSLLSPPVHGQVAPVELKDQDVTSTHIIDWFIKSIQNDTLGRIARAHLAHASLSKSGARDPACLALAQLYADTVDAGKAECVMEFPRQLELQQVPRFMASAGTVSVPCDSILAQLHRQMRQVASRTKVKRYRVIDELDPDLVLRGHERYLEEARDLKAQHDRVLRHILHKFHLTEAEALSGLIFRNESHSRRDRRRQGLLRQRVRHACKGLHDTYKDVFDERATRGQAKLVASAWYVVTYSQLLATNPKNQPLDLKSSRDAEAADEPSDEDDDAREDLGQSGEYSRSPVSATPSAARRQQGKPAPDRGDAKRPVDEFKAPQSKSPRSKAPQQQPGDIHPDFERPGQRSRRQPVQHEAATEAIAATGGRTLSKDSKEKVQAADNVSSQVEEHKASDPEPRGSDLSAAALPDNRAPSRVSRVRRAHKDVLLSFALIGARVLCKMKKDAGYREW